MWQSRPVFVSSTFLDMQAERDYLRARVFPELEEKLRGRRQYLEWVDLRAGIVTAGEDDEEVRELRVLKTCLNEVQRCRPFMIVILGDRYGWVPPVERSGIAVSEVGYPGSVVGCSVTELEIALGFLQDPEQARRTLFYLRESLPYERLGKLARAYCDGLDENDHQGVENARRLAALKEQILALAEPGQVKRYSGRWDETAKSIVAFDGWTVREDLLALLDQGPTAAAGQADGPWSEDRRALADFVEEKTRTFVGRNELIDSLTNFAQEQEYREGEIVCVVGAAGDGKSALVAKLYSQLLDKTDDMVVLAHSAGASPTAGSVDRMLRRWCDDLAEALGIESGVRKDAHPQAVEDRFAELLASAGASRSVIILLDALDQLSTARGRDLAWLPSPLPDGVRLIATTIPGKGSDALRLRSGRIEQIGPLSAEEAAEIAVEISRRYHREIDPVVLQKLCGRPGEPWRSPLWVVLAVEELNLLTADDFARTQFYSGPPAEQLRALMTEIVGDLSATIPGIYEASFARAEALFGRPLARAFLGMLAIGRAGWRESDFRSLLYELSGEAWDELTFSQLRRHFRGQLRLNQAAAAWTFTHNQMREAILARLDAHRIETIHRTVANYLLTLAGDDPLRTSEAMVHLVRGKEIASAARFFVGDLAEDLVASPYVRPEISAASLFVAEELLAGAQTAKQMLEDIDAMFAAVEAEPNMVLGLESRISHTLDRDIEHYDPGRGVSILLHERVMARLRQLSGYFSNLFLDDTILVNEAMLGSFHKEAGNLDVALLHFEAAEAACQRLEPTSSSAAPKVTRGMVASERGEILFQRGQLDEAEKAFQFAARQLVNIREICVVQGRLAEVYMAQGRFDEAHKLLSRNLDMAVMREAGVLNARGFPDLAVAHKALGDVLDRQEKFEKAMEHYNSAVAMAQRLVEQDPRREHYRLVLAASQQSRGEMLDRMGDSYSNAMQRASELSNQGQRGDAIMAYAEGFGIAQRMMPLVASAYPEAIGPQEAIANARLGMGVELWNAGKPISALRAFEDAGRVTDTLVERYPERSDIRDLAGKVRSNWKIAAEAAGLENYNHIREGRQLVRAAGGLAHSALSEGKLQDAMKYHADAVKTAGNLARLDASACELAIVDIMAAEIAEARGDMSGARSCLSGARDRAERLLAEDPAREDCLHVRKHATERLQAASPTEMVAQAEKMPKVGAATPGERTPHPVAPTMGTRTVIAAALLLLGVLTVGVLIALSS